MDVTLGEPEVNFARVRDWTAEAARRGSDLVLFPELWSTGYDLENWERYAAPPGEGMFARLAALAREHHIALGGSVLEVRDGKAYNAFALFDAEGGSYISGADFALAVVDEIENRKHRREQVGVAY